MLCEQLDCSLPFLLLLLVMLSSPVVEILVLLARVARPKMEKDISH